MYVNDDSSVKVMHTETDDSKNSNVTIRVCTTENVTNVHGDKQHSITLDFITESVTTLIRQIPRT